MVTVLNGVNELNAEVDGKTVAVVRRQLAQPMNIDPAATARVNGEDVDSTYVLEDGDALEFVKASGTKGF